MVRASRTARAATALGGLLLLVLAGAACGLLAARALWLGFGLREQPLLLRLSEDLPVSAQIHDPFALDLRAPIHTEIPVAHSFEARVRGRYEVDVHLDTTVPVRFEVRHRAVVPVETVVDLTALANFHFRKVKEYRDVRVRAEIPVQLDVPIDLTIPVEKDLPLRYEGPMTIDVDQSIRLPIRHVFRAQVDLAESVTASVVSPMDLRFHAPSRPLSVIVESADLRASTETIGLQRTEVVPSVPTGSSRIFWTD